MDTGFGMANGANIVGDLADRILRIEGAVVNFLVTADGGTVTGFVTKESVLATVGSGRGGETLENIARKDFIRVTESTSLQAVLTSMHVEPASWFLVLADNPLAGDGRGEVRGFITRERLADFIAEATEQFSI